MPLIVNAEIPSKYFEPSIFTKLDSIILRCEYRLLDFFNNSEEKNNSEIKEYGFAIRLSKVEYATNTGNILVRINISSKDYEVLTLIQRKLGFEKLANFLYDYYHYYIEGLERDDIDVYYYLDLSNYPIAEYSNGKITIEE